MATIRYLLTHKADRKWGLITRTVGMQDVAPGSPYPIGDHPEDYLFPTDKGRVLREFQLLYITRGGGWFVSAHHPRTQLRAGDAVILYPHEWHNYAPNPQVGWSEAWIGFTGPFAEELLDKFFPDKTQPIHHVGISESLTKAYAKALEVADDQMPAYQQQLTGYIALIVTTIYARCQQLPYINNPDTDNINFAIKHMRQNVQGNLSMEDVAAKAGMGYSKFRRTFKDYTGHAPAQYFLRLKMERAKDYLLSTSLSCKEIAFRLGFDSASHFNKMFRHYQGTTPMEFRKSLLRPPGPL